jgi:Na+/phosphate symporter
MTALVFLKDLIVATFSQMASLFGGIFIFGLLINFISQLTFKSLERSFGSRGTYFVAWLGTPVHELGHALFCLIFLHRIVAIEFFKPDPLTGTLGYVHHKWNRLNPWQVLGNFFIGIGPVILGCAVLFAIFYFLIPDSPRIWDSISAALKEAGSDHSIGSYFKVLGSSSLAMVKLIFTAANIASWRFWVFIYLAICVASNIRLSLSDLKIALSGLGCVIFPFLLINLIGLITTFDSNTLLPFTASSLGVIYGLLILALVMATIGFILTYLVSAAHFRLKYRSILSPF